MAANFTARQHQSQQRLPELSAWDVQAGKPQGTRSVHLGNPGLSPAALKAVLVFMYTERLDVGIEEVEPVLRVLRKCRLKHMVACVLKERRTLRYYFKSTRKDEAGPRRYSQHGCQVLCGDISLVSVAFFSDEVSSPCQAIFWETSLCSSLWTHSSLPIAL